MSFKIVKKGLIHNSLKYMSLCFPKLENQTFVPTASELPVSLQYGTPCTEAIGCCWSSSVLSLGHETILRFNTLCGEWTCFSELNKNARARTTDRGNVFIDNVLIEAERGTFARETGFFAKVPASLRDYRLTVLVPLAVITADCKSARL